MKAKNANASSTKTKQLIRDTFAELLYEKKNIGKINVTELVGKANINRSTFYLHYDDIFQVAEDIRAETLKSFFEEKKMSTSADIEMFFDQIYDYNKAHERMFKLMFQSAEITDFVQRLGKLCKDRIYKIVKEDKTIRDKNLLEIEISALSDGMAMQFIRYYIGDLQTTLEEITECGKLWCRLMIQRRK